MRPVLLTRSVSIRGELLRYSFDGATYYLPSGPLAVSTSTNMLRLGASVHF